MNSFYITVRVLKSNILTGLYLYELIQEKVHSWYTCALEYSTLQYIDTVTHYLCVMASNSWKLDQKVWKIPAAAMVIMLP